MIDKIKAFMIHGGVQYMWVEYLRVDPSDEKAEAAEVASKYEYFKYADHCHILLDMSVGLKPRETSDNLRLLDHLFSAMACSALVSEANLGAKVENLLCEWASEKIWTFDMPISMAQATGIGVGVLNCYASVVRHVKSLFYSIFSARVLEILLGKNVKIWETSDGSPYLIGELGAWMDLVTDSQDKAHKILAWIKTSRMLNTKSIDTVLQAIENDILDLDNLQTQFLGISAARTDILVGGPEWWRHNSKGVSNTFSAISSIPPSQSTIEILRGLFSIFSGLFTAEDIIHELAGNDTEKICFSFLNRLSTQADQTWIRLAIGNGESGGQEWSPISADHQPRHSMTSPQEFFAGVFNLGSIHKDYASAKTKTNSRKYMGIHLRRDSHRSFTFAFTGCNTIVNAEKQQSTTLQPIDVPKDETGRYLVQAATFLGNIFDPGADIVEYRTRLLTKIKPN